MNRRRVLGLLGLILVACAPSVASAADPSVDAVLKENGLRRSGTTYVLDAEAQLQKLLGTARDRYKWFAAARRQQQMAEQGTKDNAAMIRELTQQRLILNRQLAQATTVAERNQLVPMFNEVTDQLNLLNQDANDPEAKQKMNARVAEYREGFMQSVLDARQLVDGATSKYAELAQDASIADALSALNRTTKAKLTLGPSRSFRENVKLLEKVEQSVLTEAVSLRDENGVFIIDVTFNGKVTKAMILDTGASLVSLSAKVAEEIGLKPDQSTPTIRSQIADGSYVKVKLMKVPTMRVGKFTVNDVACIVSLPEQGDTPLLLGGSFLKNFVYHIKPDTAQLILTRVDTGDDSKAGPRRKAAGR